MPTPQAAHKEYNRSVPCSKAARLGILTLRVKILYGRGQPLRFLSSAEPTCIKTSTRHGAKMCFLVIIFVINCVSNNAIVSALNLGYKKREKFFLTNLLKRVIIKTYQLICFFIHYKEDIKWTHTKRKSVQSCKECDVV